MKDRSFSHGPFAWALKENGRERRGGAIHSAGSLHVRLWTPLGCPRPPAPVLLSGGCRALCSLGQTSRRRVADMF